MSRARRGVLAFGVTSVLALSGIATASVFAGAGDDKSEGNEQGAGVHGGPKERFHQAGACDLTAVSSLPGNWTHGDYVSTVAANGTPAQIQTAAHSDCGKPMVSVLKDKALKHTAAGQAHAGGEPDEDTAALGS